MNINDYFKNFSTSLWRKKAMWTINKINTLKKNKSKVDYINELYAIYLQLIENFIIFLLIRSYSNPVFLFDSTREINSYFKRQKNDLINAFLNELLIDVPKENYSTIRERHKKLLNEVFKDYYTDKGFLNSYKHGYRILENKFNINISMKLSNSNMPFVNFSNSPHSISYLVHRKNKADNKKYIDEYSVCFNSNYVYGKILFITDIIETSIEIYGKTGEIRVDYLGLENVGYIERKNTSRMVNRNKYMISE